MEDSTENTQKIRELAETLPEHEKQGNMIGKFFCYLANVTQSGWKEAIQNASKTSTIGEHIFNIESILHGLTEDGKEALLDALKYQKKNCSEAMNDECYNRLGCTMEEMWEQFAFGQIEKNDKSKVRILEEVKNYHLKETIKIKEPLEVV